MYQQQRIEHLFNNRQNIFHCLVIPGIGKTMYLLWKPITQHDD